MSGVLQWTLGPELITNVFPAHAIQFPFLLLFVSAWGWSTGRDRMAFVVVLAFSFVGQTHGSGFVGAGVVAGAFGIRVITRRRRVAPIRWSTLAIAAGVLIVLWIQPIIQQFFGDGDGNLTAILLRGTQDETSTLGPKRAVNVMASVLVAPPWWTRPGFTTQLPLSSGATSDIGAWPFATSLIGLVLVAALIAAFTIWMRGRGDESAVPGALLVGFTAAWGLVYMSRVPMMGVFGFMSHTARWLWPFGAFVAMFVVTGLVRHVPPMRRPRALGTTAAVGLVAIAVMPWTHSPIVGPIGALRNRQDASLTMRDSLSGLEGQGTVFVDIDGQSFDFWSDTILAELTRRGVPYVVDEAYRVVQLGDRREFDGDADLRLWVTEDPDEQLSRNAVVLVEVLAPPLDASPTPSTSNASVEPYPVRVVVEPFHPESGG